MDDNQIKNFKPFSLENRTVINRFLRKSNYMSCEFNFVNLFLWSHIFDETWDIFNDRLIIFIGRENFIFMPAGPAPSPEELIEISDYFIKQNSSGNFAQVPPEYFEKHKELSHYFTAVSNENNAEYIHLTERLVSLRGKKLRKKRNLISQFKRNNPDYKCLKLTKNLFDDCCGLAKQWCREKTCDLLSITHESSALTKAFNYYHALKLEGLVILDKDSRPVAFSIFSRHNPAMYIVHFEKSDFNNKGAAQVINFETGRHLLGKCTYINREQDLGLTGLRKAKRSYDPDIILQNLDLIRKT